MCDVCGGRLDPKRQHMIWYLPRNLTPILRMFWCRPVYQSFLRKALTLYFMMAQDMSSSCLCFLCARIEGMCHHTFLWFQCLMGHLRSHPCDHIGSSESEVLSESHGKPFPGQFRPTELEFRAWARVLGIDALKSICGSFRCKPQGIYLFLFSPIFTSTAYFSTYCLSITLFLIWSLQNKCFQIVNQLPAGECCEDTLFGKCLSTASRAHTEAQGHMW